MTIFKFTRDDKKMIKNLFLQINVYFSTQSWWVDFLSAMTSFTMTGHRFLLFSHHLILQQSNMSGRNRNEITTLRPYEYNVKNLTKRKNWFNLCLL